MSGVGRMCVCVDFLLSLSLFISLFFLVMSKKLAYIRSTLSLSLSSLFCPVKKNQR